MPRLRSRLFSLAAGVSLVACVATTVLWARSYWAGQRVKRADWKQMPNGLPRTRTCFVSVVEGTVYVGVTDDYGSVDLDENGQPVRLSPPSSLGWAWNTWTLDESPGSSHAPADPDRSIWNRLGFSWQSGWLNM